MSLSTTINNARSSQKLSKSSRVSTTKLSAVAKSLFYVKYFLLPAYYICITALHSLLRDVKGSFKDWMWFITGNSEDKTGANNFFRAIVSLVMSMIFISLYSTLEKYFSPNRASYAFSIMVFLVFLGYGYPLFFAERFKRGTPIFIALFGKSFFEKIPFPWLKEALANFFLCGFFNCMSEVIPPLFISNFWSYFDSIENQLAIQKGENIKENVSIKSSFGQLIFAIPTIFLVYLYPGKMMKNYVYTAYIMLLMITLSMIIVRYVCDQRLNSLNSTSDLNLNNIKSVKKNETSMIKTIKVPGCFDLIMSSATYFLISAFSESILSSLVSKIASNIYKNMVKGESQIVFFLYTLKHSTFVGCNVKDEIVGKVKLFLNSFNTIFTALISYLVTYSMNRFISKDKFNVVAQTTVFITSFISCLSGCLVWAGIIKVSFGLIIVVNTTVCLMRSIKYMVVDLSKYQIYSRMDINNKKGMRNIVDTLANRVAKGPINVGFDFIYSFAYQNMYGFQSGGDVYYNNAIYGIFVTSLLFMPFSIISSHRMDKALKLSIKHDITFENAYAQLYSVSAKKR